MTTIQFTNEQCEMPDTDQFDYIIEVAVWHDTGATEYIGIIGQPSRDELFDVLAAEVKRIHKWLDDDARKGNMEKRTDEPQIAIVRQRPEADEDGDFPGPYEWPVISDWN